MHVCVAVNAYRYIQNLKICKLWTTHETENNDKVMAYEIQP